MNKPFFMTVAAAIGSMLALAACAPTTPHVDSHFGESTRTTLAQQTRNPEAASNNVPEAVEGAAARESVERYRNTYREAPQSGDAFIIGLGAGRGR